MINYTLDNIFIYLKNKLKLYIRRYLKVNDRHITMSRVYRKPKIIL